MDEWKKAGGWKEIQNRLTKMKKTPQQSNNQRATVVKLHCGRGDMCLKHVGLISVYYM